MRWNEVRVGFLSIAIVVIGHGLVTWASVRENTRAIADLKAHNERQDEQRDKGRQRITEFLREYERKESEDQASNKDVERLHDDIDRLEGLINELRVIIAKGYRE